MPFLSSKLIFSKVAGFLLFSFFAGIALVLNPSPAFAANCSPLPGGNEVISSSCSFAGTINGVDAGNLTINPGATLTISNGQTIIWNSGKSLTLNGSLVLFGNGKLVKSNLWMADGDGDGWSSSTTQVYDSSATKPGYTRRSSMQSLTTVDCNDSVLSVDNLCPYPPTAITIGATNITITSATLNGSGNPGNVATTGYFRYATTSPGTCNDTFGTRVPLTDGSVLGSGNSSVQYSQVLDGILPETTYYFCAITSNAEGVGFGRIVGFATQSIEIPLFPVVATTLATNTATTSATLNGSASSGGADATAYFRYSATNPTLCNDTFGTRAPTSGGTAIAMGGQASFSRSVTGLIPNTEYYFCAIASNIFGTGTGSLLTFITPAIPPTVTTSAATVVSTTTATLNGSMIPNDISATGWVRYSTTNPGSCNDTFGTRIPANAGGATGSGSSAQSYSQAASGLSGPNITYYFCAIASNSGGTGFGSVLSFTTVAPPTITTTAATSIFTTTATLNGSANPNNLSSIGWFRYSTTNPGTCNDTFGTRTPSSSGTSLGSGASAVAYSQAISGLSGPNITYYFCAIASNSGGTGFGSILSFNTNAAPTIGNGGAAPSISTTSANLLGSANPNSLSSTGYFRYSTTNPGSCNDTFGTRAPSSGGTSLGADISEVAYGQSISGLSGPNVTYYFCAIASNSRGTSVAPSIYSFVTNAAPTATTVAASSITPTTATLNGTGNPNSLSSIGWFRYSTANPGTCNDTFGTQTSSSSLGSGSSAVAYSQAISGLSNPNVTYYFCAITWNSQYGATSSSSVLSFTTIGAPTVITSPATSVTATQATLNGSVNPNGAATTAWFRYSATNPGTCSDSFGTRYPSSGGTSLGSGTSAVLYSYNISGLSSGVTYYFCSIAQNSAGMSFGSVASFLTPAIPTVTTFAATSITTTSAILNGSANPNAAATTGWFRYSITNPGTCNDTFGTRVPSSGGTSLGSGTSAVGYNQNITLSPGIYYFCAIANNSVGTGFGSVLNFTIMNSPTATTSVASSITSTTATLNGSANPNAAATTGWFKWGPSNVACDSLPNTTSTSSLGSGTSSVAYSKAILGLSSLTTYYFCAIANNSVGNGFGSVQSLFTPTAPSITSVSPEYMVTKSAVLSPGRHYSSCVEDIYENGIIYCFGGANASNSDLSQIIKYNSETDIVTNVNSFLTARSGTSCAQNSATRKIYCFGGVANNVYLNQITEYNPANNTITTRSNTPYAVAFSSCVENSATNKIYCLGGTYGPGLSTTEVFEYNPAIDIAIIQSPLPAGRTYHSCAEAIGTGKIYCFGGRSGPGTYPTQVVEYNTTNGSAGNVFTLPVAGRAFISCTEKSFWNTIICFGGEDGTVARSEIMEYYPGSNTLAVKSVGFYGWGLSCAQNSATNRIYCFGLNDTQIIEYSKNTTLNAIANPRGASTTGWFRYWTSNPGSCTDSGTNNRVPASGGSALGSGTSDVPYNQIMPVTPNTTYYFCAIATNYIGTSYGSVLSFISQ